MVMDGPLALVQGGTGLIGRAPVYTEHDHRFWGLVSAVIDLDALFEATGVESFGTNDSEAKRKLEEIDQMMITGRNWPVGFFSGRGGIGGQW